MNLRQLEYFLVLSEELNYHQAAERLFIAQPTLSVQMSNLQREIGQPLFLKVGRHIMLTNAGLILQSHARKILRQVRATKQALQPRSEPASIKIGLSGTHLLTPLLKTFQKINPHTSFTLRENTSASTLKQLLNAEINFGIAFLPIHNPAINYRYLFTDEIIAVTTKTGPYHTLENITLTQLTKVPLIVLDPQFAIRQTLDQLFLNQHLSPQYLVEVTSYSACISALSQLTGIALVTRSFFETQKAGHADLKVISVEEPGLKQALALVFPADIPLSPKTTILMDQIQKYYLTKEQPS